MPASTPPTLPRSGTSGPPTPNCSAAAPTPTMRSWARRFATNSVLHSASRGGGEFTLRAEVREDYVRIEVEDAGGPWHGGPRDDGRPHGFDVVAAIAGSPNWGIDGDTRGRTAWARLGR
jgi:hypothetical protein